MKLLFENWRKYTQLNEEQLLIEGRIDVAKKKYPEFTKALSAGVNRDSPLDTLINADPSGNQKYLMAMARILDDVIKKAIESPPWGDHLRPGSLLFTSREAGRIADYVEKFHELQPFIRDQDKPFKDINNIKNLNALKSVINTARGKKQESERKKQMKGGVSQKAKEESRVVEETEDYIIIRPETTHASCHYGKGTKWCISADEAQNHYDSYTEQGVAFYFIFFANLPNDDQSKKLAIVINTTEGDFDGVYDVLDNQMDEAGLDNALFKNALNLKKYPSAYDFYFQAGPEPMPNAEQQYYQAMSDLGFPRVGGGQKAKQMVKEQRREILNLLIQDGRENPAGADEEQFLKVIERHALKNIEIELEMPEETGLDYPAWESAMWLNLNDVLEHSPRRLRWKSEDEIRDIETRRERGFDDYIGKALRDMNIYPTSIDDLGDEEGRGFKVTFERGHGGLDTFKDFMRGVEYEDGEIESSFDEDLIELLEDVGIIGRDEREEHYWPDPKEKEKQLDLPLQEVYKRWRQLIS